ncbi:MAG: short chain dehydrogenase [Candidatus Nephthysia bennettiae]|uniref:SDR family oxidoreductase n=1 Tax=Candidatus Nephthysia bennettiae TaxID=3127016 RepID=A0A934K3N8_9BACT|nr:SDR family oxidoreductase [Candidatus Dormibacteraeota bacterium]PZR86019.1 MAG: short chain dehydrogenase [Candidatus Dormibacteraeota bacterium]
MAYVVTGGTGFMGRHLLRALSRRGQPVRVLVREQSRERLERLGLPNITPLVGDLTSKGLGVGSQVRGLRGAEVFHLGAVYDLDADEEASRLANVEGTRHVLEFARRIRAARLHHMSSIAIAGVKFKGTFTEDMFDEGQVLDHPYYRTKFEAEKLVREQSDVPFRIYRPGLVIGSSRTGEADRTDGPYYAFKIIQRLRAALPPWVPLVGFEGGPFYVVPVDFVVAALEHIAALPGLDGQTFHLLDPDPLTLGETLNEFCRAAHAPQFTLRVDRRAFNLLPRELSGMLSSWRVAGAIKSQLMEGVRVPPAAVAYLNSRACFRADHAQVALTGSGIECPPLHSYAWKVWDYWERHLDPEALTERNLRAVLAGRVILVTGASSGIGRAVAAEVARHGARVLLVSRTREKLEELEAEIEAGGGEAWVYPADLSDLEACERMVEQALAEHGRVDVLVNNAGRSIRRSFVNSLDRFHDYERTMRLNYFGAVKLMQAVVPGMLERRTGHIVNVSSIGVQVYPPRFGAYVASKSALASLSRCVAPELADQGVAVTNIHMPLVRTPMIEPTDMYRNFPTIDTSQAAELVMQALLSRPPEVSPRLGKLGEAVDTVAPGLLHLVMTAAYHAFPETAPGRDGRKEAGGEEEISTEAAAMAYLMRGIHF